LPVVLILSDFDLIIFVGISYFWFMERLTKSIVLIIMFTLIISFDARSQSNYNQLNRIYAKYKYYYPSQKYKNACSSLAKKSQPPKKFALVKKSRPRKRAEQP